MTITWGDVRTWRSDPLETAFERAGHLQDDVERLGDGMSGLVAGSWHGTASTGARAEVQTMQDLLEDRAAEVSAVRRALAEAADAITGVERVTQDAVHFASGNALSIDDAGSVHDVALAPCFATQHDADLYTAGRRRVVQECAMLVEHSLRRAVEVDSDLCRVLQNGVLSGGLAGQDESSIAAAEQAGWNFAADGLVAPPAGRGTAAENAAWWESLSDRQRQEILQQHPEWIANRDGVSFDARDQANRALLPGYQRQLDNQLASLQQQRAQAEQAGDADALFLLDPQIQQVQDKIASLDLVAAEARSGVQILGLDINHDRTQAILGVGNVDAAGHVAVFTPGLTSTVQGMGGYVTAMQQLQNQSQKVLTRAGENPSVATVAWLGYQAPQWSTVATGNSVGLPHEAKVGGSDLAEFYRGITASRGEDVDLTALGHSYGSTTTGYALRQDTGVDRVGFFGSPGVSVGNTDGLQVPSHTAWYAEARKDPVADIGSFGGDPSYVKGMNHLETHPATSATGAPLAGSTGHSNYLNDGTTSQYNLANLVAGHPENVIEGNDRGAGDYAGWVLGRL